MSVTKMGLLLSLSLTLHASTIIWGVPVVTSEQCLSCPYGPGSPSAYALGDTFDSEYDTSSWTITPETSYSVTIPFVITADTVFNLVVTESFEAGGSTCGTADCEPQTSWSMFGEYSGSFALAPTDGGSFPGIGFVFGNSGSAPGTCDQYGVCEAGLDLTGTQTAVIDLEPGSYSMGASLSGQYYTVGDSGASLIESAALTDPPPDEIPEPRHVALAVLLLLFVVYLVSRRETE